MIDKDAFGNAIIKYDTLDKFKENANNDLYVYLKKELGYYISKGYYDDFYGYDALNKPAQRKVYIKYRTEIMRWTNQDKGKNNNEDVK